MTFNQSIQRIGFACKYWHPDRSLPAKELKAIERSYSESGTTLTWMNKQPPIEAQEKLWEIMKHNVKALEQLLLYTGSLEDGLRMMRIGSNQCSLYTHPDWAWFYKQKNVRQFLADRYSYLGDLARALDVRVSMHPGQFTVLASDNPDIVERSIEEFEYHADIIRWMGFGREFQDFKCNVHISGALGPEGIRKVLPRLSTEARNSITIENEEHKWGLDKTLELAEDVPLVLDIHHHYINTHGEYIRPADDRFKRVVDSWRGVRPVIHYSVSREEYLTEVPTNELPDYELLTEAGYKKGKLRAHSDAFPNEAANDWALEFWPHADIMCEAKTKNVAARQLYEQAMR